MQNCDKSPVDVSSRGDSGEPAWTENSRRDSPRHGICTPHLLHSSNIAHRHFGSGSTCLSQEPKLGSLDPNPRFFNIKARDTTLETREKQLARATERDVQFGPVWRVGMEGRHGVNLKIWRVENLNARIFHFPFSIFHLVLQEPTSLGDTLPQDQRLCAFQHGPTWPKPSPLSPKYLFSAFPAVLLKGLRLHLRKWCPGSPASPSHNKT